jgi:hypothetical protein
MAESITNIPYKNYIEIMMCHIKRLLICMVMVWLTNELSSPYQTQFRSDFYTGIDDMK